MLNHILNMFLEFTLCRYDKQIEHINFLIMLLKDTENFRRIMMKLLLKFPLSMLQVNLEINLLMIN